MCRGYYISGKPVVPLFIYLPSKDFLVEGVFLVDTGSDKTTLSYPTARELKIDLGSLSSESVDGIGGLSEVYQYSEGLGLVFVKHMQDDKVEYHMEPVEKVNVFKKEAQYPGHGCYFLI